MTPGKYTESWFKERGITFLPDTDYKKAVGQFRLQLNDIMQPLMLYGQKPYVEQAISEIVRLTEDFGLRVRGVQDKPIDVERVRRCWNGR